MIKWGLVSQEEINENHENYDLPSDWIDCYYPEYLPEGYSLTNTRVLVDTKYMTFSNQQGQELHFIQGNPSSQSQIDTENGKVIEVEINGNRGLLAIKDDISILNWSNNDTSFSLQGNVEESVLLNIAQSIEKNK